MVIKVILANTLTIVIKMIFATTSDSRMTITLCGGVYFSCLLANNFSYNSLLQCKSTVLKTIHSRTLPLTFQSINYNLQIFARVLFVPSRFLDRIMNFNNEIYLITMFNVMIFESMK